MGRPRTTPASLCDCVHGREVLAPHISPPAHAPLFGAPHSPFPRHATPRHAPTPRLAAEDARLRNHEADITHRENVTGDLSRLLLTREQEVEHQEADLAAREESNKATRAALDELQEKLTKEEEGAVKKATELDAKEVELTAATEAATQKTGKLEAWEEDLRVRTDALEQREGEVEAMGRR